MYPDLVVYELAGQVHLLGGASDGEDPGVGVGGGWRVPLQLHVSSRLLVNTLDGLSSYKHTGHISVCRSLKFIKKKTAELQSRHSVAQLHCGYCRQQVL